MEEDREATNLGPEVDEGMAEEPVAVPRQPKRRFVGRKTVEKSGDQPADPNANIEDSSAIQGVRRLLAVTFDSMTDTYCSRTASPHSSRLERHTRLYPARQRPQRCHRPPPTELQLRDPQMHTPYTDIRREVGSTTVPRRIAALRHDHLRHPDAVLPRHFDADHG
ncbi:hypothetical protein OPT61_g2635 [Boeremia exigua]|uniref:Uncharacterized protein n=1 Tax=Boeremia exigua TaxID=749465 RepID=A0ACC2IKX0_9PLEO|nr:hypothetical protein OPT61_g2635 [Boeremia exigua]